MEEDQTYDVVTTENLLLAKAPLSEQITAQASQPRSHGAPSGGPGRRSRLQISINPQFQSIVLMQKHFMIN